jgi:hypothetical protein
MTISMALITTIVNFAVIHLKGLCHTQARCTEALTNSVNTANKWMSRIRAGVCRANNANRTLVYALSFYSSLTNLAITDPELFDHVLVLAYNVEDNQLSCKDT